MNNYGSGHASAVRILRNVPELNTRSFPRSLAQAFPDERANAIEVYRPIRNTVRGVLLACVVGVGIAGALVAWWSA